MTETVTRLAGLDDDDLIAIHKRFDEFVTADAAIIEAHHLVTTEMLRRDIPHGHVDDAWVDAVVLIEKAEVDSPDDIDAPAGMEKAWAATLHQGGTVSVLLTADGYVLKADPTVSDVHVDAIMGSGKKRPRRVVGPAEKEFGFTIPTGVQTAARRAVKWISEGKAGDGFTSVGRNRARQLADGGSVSRDVLVKMRAYFARHGEQRGDHDELNDGEPTPWRVAWDAWGGDAGQAWVNRVLTSVEKRAIPESITDIHLNLENRQHAIDEYLYGPMNPDAPGDYWQRLADVWKVDAKEAKSTRCGNCAAFNQKPEILEAIADGISDEGDAVTDAADLGYCELFEFKCAAARSCSAWLTGGPLVKSFDKSQNLARETKATFTLPDGAVYEVLVPEGSKNGLETISKHVTHDQKTHGRRGGASGRLDPEIALSIIERVRANGGLSVSMVDGSEPVDGYMVARVGVKAAIVEADDFYDTPKGTAALASFLIDNKAELTGGDYLGVWHDTDGGKVYLDVSENVKDRATAERLGSPSERNQISIWDVVEGKEIPTGGTGELEKAKAFRGDQIAGSVENDRRGDRGLRERDLRQTEQSVVKHQAGKHDQKTHGRWAGTNRRSEAMTAGDTRRPLMKDAQGRVINPNATGGYKANIPESVKFKNETLTPDHSLWHHLESDNSGGYRFTEERAALHREIVRSATESVSPSSNPTFYMLGGGPASGKTTAIESGLAGVPNRENAVQINADDIKEQFPEYDRMRFSDNDNDFFNAAAFSHEESSYVAKQVQNAAFDNRQDVVLDGTGDSEYSKLERKVGQARDGGYKVIGVYATMPTEKSLELSNKRALGESKRFVPEKIVRETHKEISRVFPEATRRGLFDAARLIDTSNQDKAVVIGATDPSGRFQVYDESRWQSFIDKGEV